MQPIVRLRALSRKLKFDGAKSLQYFVSLVGVSTAQVDQELDKISLYLDGESPVITIDIVRLNVSRSYAGIVFEVGNAIGACDVKKATDLVDKLLKINSKESGIGILLAAIVPKVRHMFYAKLLLQNPRVNPRATRHCKQVCTNCLRMKLIFCH